jgi:2-C-methyl-D-erythritol 4-phosphate cytidylyltransferase
MIEWSIDAFRACESVHSIVVVAPPGRVGGLNGHPDLGVVPGGATRAQSVANGLEEAGTELVAIHDAARPLLTPGLVEAMVARLGQAPEAAGVIAATPVTDTVKQAGEATNVAFCSPGMHNATFVIERTLDRAQLWAAQTPQLFRTEALRAALAVEPERRDAATDEAMLVEEAGGTVLLHPVGPDNFKVTTPLDLRVATLVLEGRSR